MEGFADDGAALTARGSVVAGDRILAVSGTSVVGTGQAYLRSLLRESPDPVILLLRRDPPQARAVGGSDDEDDLTADSYGSGGIVEASSIKEVKDPPKRKRLMVPPPGYYYDQRYGNNYNAYYAAPYSNYVNLYPLRQPRPLVGGIPVLEAPPVQPPPREGEARRRPPRPEELKIPKSRVPQRVNNNSTGAAQHRFGLGPLNAVLASARADVEALVVAYEANAFTRWQLKMALLERLPTLDGLKPRILKQGGGGCTSLRLMNDDQGGSSTSSDTTSKELTHPRAVGSPEEKQRMLMLMLAHDLSPQDICAHVLKKDKEVHLRRDKLVASQGYWVAISQERMRALYDQNGQQRVYVYFDENDVAPLPAKFTDCGFARTRASMNIDKKSNGTTLRAQVQRVQFTFRSAAYPNEAPLIVEYDLYHTKPYIDLLGVDEPKTSIKKTPLQDITKDDDKKSQLGDYDNSSRKRDLLDADDNDDDENLDDDDDDDDDPAETRKAPSRRKDKKARLQNGTLYPSIDTLNQLAAQALRRKNTNGDDV